jgi:GNAT superfamily N-acetyltransferase
MATDAHAATIAITALDPADASVVDGAFQVLQRARSHDIPDFPPLSRHRFEVSLRVAWPSERVIRWVARAGADVVGHLEVNFPMLDNLDNAFVEITVDPEYRRRGLGRALYEHAVAFVKAEGRRRLMALTPDMPFGDGLAPDPGGSAFAPAMGMINALDDVRRRLDLTDVDQVALEVALAAAWIKAEGYSLVRWAERTPDEFVDDVAYLDGRLSIDAPLGDLVWEQDKVDAARIRAAEDVRAQYGNRNVSTAARHDASGRIVAWSALMQERGNHDHAWQGITIVDPDHRGHRLGTIVKIENLRYAVSEFPALRFIDTWNAAVNDYMISINELMGFRKKELWRNWQQEV